MIFFSSKNYQYLHNKHNFSAHRTRGRFHFDSQYTYTKKFFLIFFLLSTYQVNEFIVVI